MLNGYYVVNDNIIESKYYAAVKASETNSPLLWNYYDDVFGNVDRSNLGIIPIRELYKERAQQLRDTYDYLILNYSGGSDSYTILRTFLDNNIKLDHIFVQVPMSVIDKGLYIPNSVDKSNANHYSEWDLNIKKDLIWLSQNYPEIKIEIGDWTDKLTKEFHNDSIFEFTTGVVLTVTRSLKMSCFSVAERELASQGKKVASIYGVDKPNIVEKDNTCYFYFVDKGGMTRPNPDNPNGTEYFYISPNFPKLAVEQAYRFFKWFDNHPEKRYLIKARSERTDPGFKDWSVPKHFIEVEQRYELAKYAVYPDWDFNRFQSGKPIPGITMSGFRGWDLMFYNNIPEVRLAGEVFNYHLNSYKKLIDKKYLMVNDELITCTSKWHFLAKRINTDNDIAIDQTKKIMYSYV